MGINDLVYNSTKYVSNFHTKYYSPRLRLRESSNSLLLYIPETKVTSNKSYSYLHIR